MAIKLYGQLIGTARQARLAGAPWTAAPRFAKDSADQVLWRDTVLLNGNLIGDTIQLAVLRSTVILDPVLSSMCFDALGTGAQVSFGDASFPGGLRPVFSAASAAAFTPMMLPAVAAMAVAPLWQRLGYAADPGRPIELLATLAGANPANVGLTWQFFGRNL